MVSWIDADVIGSLADWVAGIGSIGVGIAALRVASLERNRAVAAEKRLEKIEAERHNDLIIPALRITARAQVATSAFLEAIERGEALQDAKARWFRVLDQAHERALRMQQFPHSNPELYSEYDELASTVDVSDSMREWAIGQLSNHASRVRDDLERQDRALKAMADEGALLKW